MSQTPDLTEVLEAAHRKFMSNFFTALPGVVQSFSELTRTAMVQPGLKRVYWDEEDNRQTETLPVVRAPVVFPGSGGYEITFPIKPGDNVLLVMSSLPFGMWMHLGGVVDPLSYWRNHLSDVVAIPGLRSYQELRDLNVPLPLSNAMLVRAPSGGKIKLGCTDREEADTKPVTRTTDVQDALKGALTDSNIVAGILASTTDGGASLITAVNAYFAAHPVQGAERVEAL